MGYVKSSENANNQENKSSHSNTLGFLSGGMSTNEDTFTSNCALKKYDESSFAGISTELQITKVSNEAVDKENNA